MAEVRPGDIVLHYSDGFVRAVSRVQTAPQQAVYPEEDHREYGGRVGNLIRRESRLPRSFAKVRRMMANLRANQFASFAE